MTASPTHAYFSPEEYGEVVQLKSIDFSCAIPALYEDVELVIEPPAAKQLSLL